MVLDEDGAETVEELERRDDVALYEDGGGDCGGGPVAGADGHFVKPLLERKLAYATAVGGTAKHVVHVHVLEW